MPNIRVTYIIFRTPFWMGTTTTPQQCVEHITYHAEEKKIIPSMSMRMMGIICANQAAEGPFEY